MKIIYLLPFLVTATFIGCSEDSSSTSVNDSANSSATVQEEISSNSEDIADSTTTLSSSSVKENSSDSEDSVATSSESMIESSSKGFADNYDPETGILTDERDGEVYKTAKIGNQIWMGENLRYFPPDPVEDCDLRWIDGREKPDSLDTYGRTYSWIEATRISCNFLSETVSFGNENHPLPFKGICPKGWHIPSLDEWKIAIETTDQYLYKLLSTDWVKPGYSGTDEYGFNVLKPANGTHVEFIMLDNTGSKSPTMVFNDIGGSTLQLETNFALKTVEGHYLRCLMD